MARNTGASGIVDVKVTRRKRVDDILQQALRQPPEERPSFLDRACSGDDSLRLELERLLRQEGETTGFLTTRLPGPAAPDPAESADTAPPDLTGRKLSHYRIAELVGSGGMGVVWRAWDEHLQRDVAVKVLPAGILTDPVARRRFRKEALSLSRLNHPNIGTIFDFDSQDGVDFLVMEYLPGGTLRARIAGGPLPEAEVSELGEQLALGLEAAHAQGIIHCDLKPSNVISAPDGRLKIFDFGLARILHPAGEGASTKTLTETGSGGGTLPYMSPEQLRGEAVDERSDLFSCGAVLYEMTTGRRAFSGTTKVMVADAILNRQPTAPSLLNPGVSPGLERIILKALEKAPRDRYHSAKELLADLRRHSARPAPPEPEPGRTIVVRALKISAWLLPSAAALIAGGWLWFGPSRDPLPEFRQFPLTATANWEGEPEVSPDGKEIVYTSDASGNRDIWLLDLATSRTQQLTSEPADDSSPTWFPDGSGIAFVSERGGSKGIWKVSRSGGQAELLLPSAEGPAISPGGRFLAYSKLTQGGSLRIGTVSLGARDDVRILTTDKDGLWDHLDPAWSPDGTELCYWTRDGIWVIPFVGGPARRLISGDEIASHPVWAKSTQFIYYTSYRGGTLGLWRVGSRGGSPQPVASGTGGALIHPSLAPDGKHLIYATGTRDRQDVLLSRDTGTETIFSVSQTDLFGSLATDGSYIVYASTRGLAGGFNLWRQILRNGRLSGQAEPLTAFPYTATDPAISPDGKWVAYVRIVNAQRDIWIMPASGGDHLQFTSNAAADVHPAWSPDGSMLVFASDRGDVWQLWVAGVKDGRPLGRARSLPTQSVSAMLPDWSPDGKNIAFTGESGDRPEVWLVPALGGSPARRVTNGSEVRRVRWDPVSGDIIASATWGTQRVSLWRVNPETGGRRPFSPKVEFGGRNDYVGLFDLSRNGQYMIFARSQGSQGQICILEALKGTF